MDEWSNAQNKSNIRGNRIEPSQGIKFSRGGLFSTTPVDKRKTRRSTMFIKIGLSVEEKKVSYLKLYEERIITMTLKAKTDLSNEDTPIRM